MNNKIYIATAFVLALTACSNDDENGVLTDGAVKARIVANINIPQTTRATDTEWALGDKIGITANGGNTNYQNIEYTLDNNEDFTSETNIYFQDAEEVTFNAYYPYYSLGDVKSVTTDAEAQENKPEIDFLFASGAKASKTAPVVKFINETATGGADHSFHHRMSQVSLRLIKGVDIRMELTGYKLQGLVLQGTFDTETGEAVAKANESSEDLIMNFENFAFENNEYTTDPVILFPQTPTDGHFILNLFSSNGGTFTATLTLPEINLKAGYSYTFPVTVMRRGAIVSTAEIASWNQVTCESTDADLM